MRLAIDHLHGSISLTSNTLWVAGEADAAARAEESKCTLYLEKRVAERGWGVASKWQVSATVLIGKLGTYVPIRT
jgi:hypothetical protein